MCTRVVRGLHVFELIDATFRVAFANFTKSFIFVAALTHILLMKNIVHSNFRVVLIFSELLAQKLIIVMTPEYTSGLNNSNEEWHIIHTMIH